jgi:hypothetical protein
VLDLSKLDSITIEGDARFGRFHILAAGGGRVNLSELDSVTNPNRPTRCYSRGAGSVVDISKLADLSQVWELRAEGGEIRWANPNSILNVGLHVSAGGMLDASNVSSARNNWLDAANNGRLSLPALRSFTMDANQPNIDWQATGAGSVLDLSKLDSITMEGDARFGRFHVVATNRGRIDLSELDTVTNTNRPTRFYSRGAGSVVDISKLADLSQVWELRAEGGEIRWANPGSIVNVGLHVSAGGTIDASNVATARNNWLEAGNNGRLSLPGLRSFAMDANQPNVDWQAAGAGSMLDLSKLDSITVEGDARFGRFHVTAQNGGRIDLSQLDALVFTGTRPVRFRSLEAGSLIDISALPALSNSTIHVRNGQVRTNNALMLSTNTAITGTGTIIGGIVLSGGAIEPSETAPNIGSVTISGDLTIRDGSYTVDIAGLNSNQVDALTVNGTATLGGTLALRANFPARIGNQVTILRAASVNGHFSRVTGIPIANSRLGFAIGYLNQEVFARATLIGDVNLDNEFNSSDLVRIFQAGEYEDSVPDNSTWIDGDWNGDGDFDSGDLVVAFQTGAYETGPVGAVAVPEPMTGAIGVWTVAWLACLGKLLRGR